MGWFLYETIHWQNVGAQMETTEQCQIEDMDAYINKRIPQGLTSCIISDYDMDPDKKIESSVIVLPLNIGHWIVSRGNFKYSWDDNGNMYCEQDMGNNRTYTVIVDYNKGYVTIIQGPRDNGVKLPERHSIYR